MKTIDFMTAKKTDFKELPKITELPEGEREFDSLIIIPERYKHDSGYMRMSFAGCKGDKAVCIMGGGSDVIHLTALVDMEDGGTVQEVKYPKKIPLKAWSIDCIPCGCLRILARKGKITMGSVPPSFEIYADHPTEKGGEEK